MGEACILLGMPANLGSIDACLSPATKPFHRHHTSPIHRSLPFNHCDRSRPCPADAPLTLSEIGPIPTRECGL